MPARRPPPRYNIAPTQTVDFVHLDKAGNVELNQGRWWLVPFFAKELPKAAMFNARIETIDTSGAFREGFKLRRCLIPADGYFEWTTNAEDGKKDPWLLQMEGGAGFSFAGIWAHNDNLGVTSCTIITAPAAPQIEHIHTRMPVIISSEVYAAWLDTGLQGADAKALLLGSQIDSLLTFHRVGREVNNSRYEGTDTKKPIINSLWEPPMPMNGAMVLSDVRADIVVIECDECGRRGVFSTQRAIESYGRKMGLPHLLTLKVKAAGCPNIDNLAPQGCKARYS